MDAGTRGPVSRAAAAQAAAWCENIAKTSPYMHAGHFASLQEVLEHYNRAPAAPVGDTELKPLNLSVTELAHLEAFLRGLSGPLKTPPELR